MNVELFAVVPDHLWVRLAASAYCSIRFCVLMAEGHIVFTESVRNRFAQSSLILMVPRWHRGAFVRLASLGGTILYHFFEPKPLE